MDIIHLNGLTEQILKLDKNDMDTVFQLLIQRWESAYPDYALLLTSVPKNDPQEQKRILEFAFRMIDEQAGA